MGTCTSVDGGEPQYTEKELERASRYDPAADSSCDEYSDCASSDDDGAAHLLPGGGEAVPAAAQRRDLVRRRVKELDTTVQDMKGTIAELAGLSASSHGQVGRVHIATRVLDRPAAMTASASYWHLGEQKWREAIDMSHQATGRFTYDLCLHGGNGHRKEIGYLASMYDAWRFADDEIGFKSSERTWLALHFLAMQHPGNDFLNGRFRHLKQGNRAFISKQLPMSDKAIAEFKSMPPRLCYLKSLDDSFDRLDRERHCLARFMPGMRRKSMRRYMRQYVSDFYKAVGLRPTTAETVRKALEAGTASAYIVSPPDSASDQSLPEVATVREGAERAAARTRRFPEAGSAAPWPGPVRDSGGGGGSQTDDSADAPANATDVVLVVEAEWAVYPPPRDAVIDAAAVLQQRLARMEPSRDGNTRTAVVLINKLLCECGLAPGIFKWPDGAAIMSREEWRAEIEAALQRGADVAASPAEHAECPLPDRWKPENNRPQGVSESAPDVVKAQAASLEKKAALKEAAQFARRPWFSDELLWRYTPEAEDSEDKRGRAHVPPRSAFESPVGLDYNQRNAFFTS